MGITDSNSEREEMVSWLKQHETQFYIHKLDEEITVSLQEIARFNTYGEELTRDFYRLQGFVLGLERSKELPEELAKGTE